MFKILLITIISTFVFAQTPHAFPQIANPIYNNAQKILNLKAYSQYRKYEPRIDNYFFDVDSIKDIGFAIDAKKKVNARKYLYRLRTLKKTNDFFNHIVNSDFHNSIATKNNDLFIQTVNSGMIDTKKYRKQILSYYKKHSNDINSKGIIQTYLDQDEKARLKRLKWLRSRPTKAELQRARFKRIQARAKAKKLAREKRLLQKLRKEKLKIRKEQERELSR